MALDQRPVSCKGQIWTQREDHMKMERSSISQGTPGGSASGRHKESEEAQPAETLVPDLWLPEMRINSCCLSYCLQTSLQQPQETYLGSKYFKAHVITLQELCAHCTRARGNPGMINWVPRFPNRGAIEPGLEGIQVSAKPSWEGLQNRLQKAPPSPVILKA